MRPADPPCKWCSRPADVILDEWESDPRDVELSPQPIRLCALCLAYYTDDQRCPQCGECPCSCPQPCSECGQHYPCSCRNYVDPYDYDYAEEIAE